ncbi:Putative hect E3 ubiquitin ligase [Zea mays]|uniref:HECT-type E3 ubiquitin transferase n=1 Tax=Zea mays TaxID=4577 RepID=A0A1D6GXT7_MAIZE|nr:Putative hect E3 ubiquitin ligase [Zea mays]
MTPTSPSPSPSPPPGSSPACRRTATSRASSSPSCSSARCSPSAPRTRSPPSRSMLLSQSSTSLPPLVPAPTSCCSRRGHSPTSLMCSPPPAPRSCTTGPYSASVLDCSPSSTWTSALKKISLEHPTACLRAGALMAVLSYLDFFSTGVQRVALSTAANICRKLPSDASEFVMEAVPLLTNLLNHHDSKVLEHASVCLTRIAEAFAYYPDKLDELCNHGLVAQAASLIAVGNSSGQTSLSTSTYTGLIRLLSICASGSLLAVKTLLLLGISGTLKDILSGSALISGTSVSPAVTRPADQMFEIVSLADDLLPHIPARIIKLPTYYHTYKGSSTKKSASIKQEGGGSTGNERSGRERLLREQPELLQQFGMDLLPTMTQVYGSSVNAPIRHKCLSIIGKLMYYSSAETIQSLLGTTNISSFLAGILAWKDPQVLIPALQIAEIMMEKLPETFSKLFVREGVVHAVESLICSESSNKMPSQVPPQDKDKDSAMPSRSRRQRRRAGAVAAENSSLDESNSSNLGVMCSTATASEAPNTSLRFTVSDHAKSFKDKYFPADTDSSDIGFTDDLLKLRALCAKFFGHLN